VKFKDVLKVASFVLDALNISPLVFAFDSSMIVKVNNFVTTTN